MNKTKSYLYVLLTHYILIFFLSLGYFHYSFTNNYLKDSILKSVDSITKILERDLQEGNYRSFVEKASLSSILGNKIINISIVNRIDNEILASSSSKKQYCPKMSDIFTIITNHKKSILCYIYNDFLKIELEVNKFTFIKYLKDLHYLTFLTLLFIITISSSIVLLKMFDTFMEKLLVFLQSFLSKPEKEITTYPKEYQKLITPINNIKDSINALEQENIKLHTSKSLSKVAKQVAHDIRSPLSALDMLLEDMNGIAETKRVLARSSISRIHDIANDLLEKNRKITRGDDSNNRNDETKKYLLSGLIESIVSEKRLIFRGKPNVSISARLGKKSYGLFVNINQKEFKRVLSNLINNSVEAIGNSEGIIEVFSSKIDQNKVQLIIKDNGKGIPPEILTKLGNEGETHGKEYGSGIGLFHAKNTIESWSGSLNINSKVNHGTEVKLTIPLDKPPMSFVSNIRLHDNSTIVVLDDDQAIHNIWDERVKSLNLSNSTIIHFSDPNKFQNWSKDNSADTYFVDFEYLGEKINGIEIIKRLNINKSAFLVTSRFEDEKIIQECESLKIGLIPKGLAGFVPIIKDEDSLEQPIQKQGKQIVLLDDDELIRMTWKMRATSQKIYLYTYATAEELIQNLSSFSQQTLFYIDSNLGNDLKGENVANTLFEMGFENLFLATGYEREQFSNLPYIKGIIGKSPPF